jgi:steroid delta-isomerase-like uncharacterized protein
MSSELKRLVQRFYEEAWNDGQLGVIDELFAPDYQDHDAAAHTGLDGRASAKMFVEIFRRGLPDLHLSIQDQICEGRTVVTRWIATGTQTGPVLGIEPTGRAIEVDGISIDRFNTDGKFVEGWGTWDGLRMLRQLGVLTTG